MDPEENYKSSVLTGWSPIILNEAKRKFRLLADLAETMMDSEKPLRGTIGEVLGRLEKIGRELERIGEETGF